MDTRNTQPYQTYLIQEFQNNTMSPEIQIKEIKTKLEQSSRVQQRKKKTNYRNTEKQNYTIFNKRNTHIQITEIQKGKFKTK